MTWRISGAMTTDSGTRQYNHAVAGSLDDVWRARVFHHRELDTVETITSPDGSQMSEFEFLELLLRQRTGEDT